jgi:hypothetical protein
MDHPETPEEELTRLASLNADGSRRFMYPADVAGRFARLRKVAFVATRLPGCSDCRR